MYRKLSNDEIDFVCTLHDPIAIKECLYPENIKAPHLWIEEDCELVKIRNYQMAWQNYSHMFCDDDSLTKKQNFQKKKDAGTCYNIGARNTGKSYDFIQMDTPVNIMLSEGRESCLGSATDGFLKKVSNPILNILREHPFFQIFKKTGKNQGIQAGNNIEAQTRHGHTFYGRNEKIGSPEPGTKFHGLHYDTLEYEEISYATEQGEEKRVDSGSSLGVIERFSGIPDIKLGSPLGNILYNEDLKKWICRLPQYVREDWDNNRRKYMIEKYKSATSMAYKLNVGGEIIEGAEGFWDIERIKKFCLDKSRKIKQFDIDKKKFKNFQKHIIIDRLPATQIFCCADIGAGSRPTEIIIVFYNNEKYKLVYNIILNKLTSREQAKVFAYIYKKLGSCFIGIDTTTDYGILDYLEKDYKIPKKHLLGVDLRKNVAIGFETDEATGKILTKGGKKIVKYMVAIDWAMQQLENLFYEAFMSIPLDNKLFKEFIGFKVLSEGLRKSYGSSTTDDYHQAFQVFAITRWHNKWQTLINMNNTDQDGCLGVI
jgi:hypothetical protein